MANHHRKGPGYLRLVGYRKLTRLLLASVRASALRISLSVMAPLLGQSLRTNTRLYLTVFSLGLPSLMLVSTLLGARLTIR